MTQYDSVPVYTGQPPAQSDSSGYFHPPVTTSDGILAADQARAVAEVQAALVIAASRPRDELRARDRLLQACRREKLAAGALYQYSRGGTEIEGPSIRLAEAAARAWGNMTYGFRETSRRAGVSECEAFAWDLETNTKAIRQFTVKHWRDTKKGGYAIKEERDIYELMANQAQRRVRAAILEIIPGDIIEDAIEQCKETQKATVGNIEEASRKLVASFAEFGVSRKQIEKRLGHHLDAIQAAQIINLRKIWTSLRDGMSRPDDWFEPEDVANSATTADIVSRVDDAPEAAGLSAEEEQNIDEANSTSAYFITCPDNGKQVDELECPNCPKREKCPAWEES